MADGVSMKVEGLDELKRRMRQIGPKLAKKGLRSATNAASQVIKKRAKQLAPKDTGRLSKKAIYVKRSRSGSGDTKETYIVGVRVGKKEQEKDRDAFYWFYHEFGTVKMAPSPFLQPAFEDKKFEAVEKFKQKLSDRLDKLVPRA